MREIKFRAWDKEEDIMVNFDKIIFKSDFFDNPFRFELKDGDFIWMQFTGLKDKNGKEIYEGDIVKIKVYESYDGDRVINAEIYFENGSFWYKGENFTDCNWHHYESKDREVIGNIYENPELLQVSKSS